MADTLVILGSVVFQDFAIPEKINFGGKQQNTIHRMIGGARVVDAMGPDPTEITWSGKFRGANALAFAEACDAMRIAGLPVSLTWLGLFYTVLVSEFKAETEKFYEVPYTVTCVVVTDPAQAIAATGGGLTALVGGDVAAALAAAPTAALSAVTALSALTSAVPSFVGAPASTVTPILASVTAAQAALTATAAASDAVLSAGIGSANVAQQPAVLAALIAACANESAAQGAYALVTRVGVNLTTGAV